MRNMTIDEVKQTKTFYRNALRRSVNLLIFSLVLNGLLCVWIYNKLITIQQPNYYATNGVKAPIQLTPLSTPNYSSTPLLAADPPTTSDDLIPGSQANII